jgi:hypothetical protein
MEAWPVPSGRSEFVIRDRALSTCPLVQGTGLHSLSVPVLKTGLTAPSTKTSISSKSRTKAHGSDIAAFERVRAPGTIARKYKLEGLRILEVYEW